MKQALIIAAVLLSGCAPVMWRDKEGSLNTKCDTTWVGVGLIATPVAAAINGSCLVYHFTRGDKPEDPPGTVPATPITSEWVR